MRASDDKKLKDISQCALCGQNATLNPVHDSPWWRVRCRNFDCGCTTWAFQSKEEAITAWNRRNRGANA